MLPSRRNTNFHKIDVFALKSKIDQKSIDFWYPKSMQNQEKTIKNRFKINVCFHMHFLRISEPTWLDFGLQVGAQKREPPRLISKSAPRAPQESPKSVPRASKSAPRAPKSAPRAPKSAPRASQERPKRLQVQFLRVQRFALPGKI